MEQLFSIGDVSKLFHLSVSSLRHYEALGLLTPERVDPNTGYRSYSIRQFEVLNTIRYLRALDMPLSEIADQISYVSQDNYLFNRSIRENIRMGSPSATDAEVEQAAKQSGCDAFIRKLDNGYDTVVGSAGSHLSGGERQRIAIARAMLKNAPVVILDEATAYIDPENEALVQKAISTLTVGKTLIVIAHRLSTIVGADNIVVVKDGTIHAQGTHEKLLETCPLYRDMWQAHIGAKHWAVSSARKEG